MVTSKGLMAVVLSGGFEFEIHTYVKILSFFFAYTEPIMFCRQSWGKGFI